MVCGVRSNGRDCARGRCEYRKLKAQAHRVPKEALAGLALVDVPLELPLAVELLLPDKHLFRGGGGGGKGRGWVGYISIHDPSSKGNEFSSGTDLLMVEADVAEAALLVRRAEVVLQRAEGAALGAVI